MGRFLMYTAILLLAVFVMASYTILKHGNEGLGQVRTLSIHEVTSNARAYDTATITVDGVVIYNDQLDRYELTDDDASFPVVIDGLSADVLAPLVNQRVRVNGKFVLKAGQGSHIEAESIRALETPSPTPSPAGS
jgi:uncharacterized protein YdeI (BOF family)